MKLLYGTGNLAKVQAMQNRLSELNIELISLNDLKKLGFTIPEVPETGSTPLENARQKAHAYYEAFHMPVFSCDSGLYFEDVPGEIQPGVHVRTVNGEYLTDEQMLAHYTGLVRQYGRLKARYKNAICFVRDAEHSFEAMNPDMESETFWLTDTPHSSIRRVGFPLDSISLDPETGQYFYDLPDTAVDRVAVEDGFLTFFQDIICKDVCKKCKYRVIYGNQKFD